jgi:hypothetical protein
MVIVASTTIFFGMYEAVKRHLVDWGMMDTGAHLVGGALGDVAASGVYVPTEVIKARLQLQGRYNNPFYGSGYNYKNTLHALRTARLQ